MTPYMAIFSQPVLCEGETGCFYLACFKYEILQKFLGVTSKTADEMRQFGAEKQLTAVGLV